MDKEQQIFKSQKVLIESDKILEPLKEFVQGMGYDVAGGSDFEAIINIDERLVLDAHDKVDRIRDTKIEEELWEAYNYFVSLVHKYREMKKELLIKKLINQ